MGFQHTVHEWRLGSTFFLSSVYLSSLPPVPSRNNGGRGTFTYVSEELAFLLCLQGQPKEGKPTNLMLALAGSCTQDEGEGNSCHL